MKYHQQLPSVAFSTKLEPSPVSTIEIDSDVQYQTIEGFGGAFTEASSLHFSKLSKVNKEKLLQLYFSNTTGAGYRFGRVPMNSCDFSSKSYNFDPVADDVNLTYFNMQHDTETIIPFVKEALLLQPDLKLFTSPWSPPAWMKNPINNTVSMLSSAKPIGLNPVYQQAWALYFAKFISAYKDYGISFWGITVQNEPEFAAAWESCVYTASFQATFVGQFLGPLLAETHPNVKIMAYDHNRNHVFQWAKTVFNNTEASKYVSGMAFHWYSDDARYLDGAVNHIQLTSTHNLHPKSKFILATESCNCPGVETNNAKAWARGQRYAHDILLDFNHWSIGWVDWNLILDEKGGPNHLGNFCDAPVIASGEDFRVQPMYYFITHFSKYVVAGSKRIKTAASVSFDQSDNDPNVEILMEGTIYNCENSSRQKWSKTSDSKIQLINTGFCLDTDGQDKIMLVMCIYTSHAWTFNQDGRITFNGKCLSLTNGLNQEGGLLNLDTCNSNAPYQQWEIKNGEMRSKPSRKCVTAGYAFFQAAGFVTPSNKKVMVVLNENSIEASFSIKSNDGNLKSLTLPAGAIQTYQWD